MMVELSLVIKTETCYQNGVERVKGRDKGEVAQSLAIFSPHFHTVEIEKEANLRSPVSREIKIHVCGVRQTANVS